MFHIYDKVTGDLLQWDSPNFKWVKKASEATVFPDMHDVRVVLVNHDVSEKEQRDPSFKRASTNVNND